MSSIPSPSRRSLLPALALCALAGLFLGSVAFTFDYAEATSYLSNDPKTCVNCHVMRDYYDGWAKGPHHARAVCNDCHVPQEFVGKYWTKAVHGYRHSKGFTFDDFHEPITIKPDSLAVVQANCVRCHAETVSQIGPTGVVAAGRGVHGLAADAEEGGISCIHCHAAVGHGPTR